MFSNKHSFRAYKIKNKQQNQIDSLEVLEEENVSDVENIQEFQELSLKDVLMPVVPSTTTEYELQRSVREKRLTLRVKEKNRSNELA